jgi:hypothetical protein
MNMKINSKLVVVFYVLFMLADASIFGVSTVNAADVATARLLYGQGKYLESINIVGEQTEEEVYLKWLNEINIGGLAGPMSDDPNDENHKYYSYVIAHPEMFYSASSIAAYKPSNYRYDQLKKINPNSVYLGEIEYRWKKDFDDSVWEDGDGTRHSREIINDYENLIGKYPNASFVSETRARIEEIKVLHKDITGSLP